MIVLVLGAGTDYGLFLVFRVREELRAGQHGQQGASYPGTTSLGGSLLGDLLHPRQDAREAIVRRGDQGRRVDHVLRGHGDRGRAHPAAGQSSRSTPTSACRSPSPSASS